MNLEIQRRNILWQTLVKKWNLSRIKFRKELHFNLAQENRIQHTLLMVLTVTMRVTRHVTPEAFPHLWQLPDSFYLSWRLGLCLRLDLWDLHLRRLLLLLPQELEVSGGDGFARQLDCWCGCEQRQNKMLWRFSTFYLIHWFHLRSQAVKRIFFCSSTVCELTTNNNTLA